MPRLIITQSQTQCWGVTNEKWMFDRYRCMFKYPDLYRRVHEDSFLLILVICNGHVESIVLYIQYNTEYGYSNNDNLPPYLEVRF